MPWEIVSASSEIIAIHAALTPVGPRGQVVYFSGDQHSPEELHAGKIDNTRVYDLASGTIMPIYGVNTDLFCCGHAFLPDGRLLVAGGTAQFDHEGGGPHEAHFKGERAAWIFAPRAAHWTRAADMRPEPGHEGANTGGGRWYPSLVTLASGQVLAVSGHPSASDTRHNNTSPEVYTAAGNFWSLVGGPAADSDFYPRLFVLPSGRVFCATPVNGKNRLYDTSAGAFVGPVVDPPADGFYGGLGASAVLLPLLPADGYKPRVLMTNGLQPVRITVDGASPAWQNAGARTGAAAGRGRTHGYAVLLPTGQVLVCGGINPTPNTPDANAVLEGEIYTPGVNWAAGTYTASESWTTVEAATVARNYHSSALLLPDGRVWTAGSDHDGGRGLDARELRIEIYKPAYDADPARPELTATPASVGYGEQFEVRTPQAESIQRVALIRAGSATHAFNFDQRYVGLAWSRVGTTDRLRVDSPPNSAIAPPGTYMLWVVDNANRPCKLAKFVRVTHQTCLFVTDRSSFSSYEVDALLTLGPATFARALYIIVEGVLPSEVGSPPALAFTFDNAAGAVVPGLSASLREIAYEDPLQPLDIAQRVTFVYDVTFTNSTAFSTFTETRRVNVRATTGSHVCDAQLDLLKQPNPYMRDGDPAWLSIDLRVFQIRPGQTRFGVTHPSGNGAPQSFLADLLSRFNATPTDEFHPFNDIPTDQQASALELSREVNGQRVFNYAVAKVRYRAIGTPAPDVRTFFRLFRCVGTPFEYDKATLYRRTTDGPTAQPLLGRAGGEVISIPFFAAPRVTPAQAMTDQTDDLNQRTLSPMGPAESAGYFACWLDFNQTDAHIPLNAATDGPYVGMDPKSIQELMRGDHSCLIAEVHFKPSAAAPELIAAHATPGTSDKLSQRNLALVHSGNPGSVATRTVQHTFEVKASASAKDVEIPSIHGVAPQALDAATHAATHATNGRLSHHRGPNELMIFRNTVPRGSVATMFMPDVDADEVIGMASARLGPSVLEKVDGHTLRFKLGDVTFVPLPAAGARATLPGLLSVGLPPGVTKRQVFSLTAHEFSGVTRRVIGSFQMTIPVEAVSALLAGEARRLSVLRHVARAIPAADHWHPIFERYVNEIADRVRGFGADPDHVKPSPDGDGGRAPGDDAKTTTFVGKIDRLVYSCFGDFEGFVLDLCPGEHALRCHEPAIERLLRDACEKRWLLRVLTHAHDRTCIHRIEVKC